MDMATLDTSSSNSGVTNIPSRILAVQRSEQPQALSTFSTVGSETKGQTCAVILKLLEHGRTSPLSLSQILLTQFSSRYQESATKVTNKVVTL